MTGVPMTRERALDTLSTFVRKHRRSCKRGTCKHDECVTYRRALDYFGFLDSRRSHFAGPVGRSGL